MTTPPTINLLSSPHNTQQTPGEDESTQPPAPPSSSHRLPTFSASQALQNLQSPGYQLIPTGLASLDALLSPFGGNGGSKGGLERGKVTEIWGPCGSGRTGLVLQTAVGVLREGGRVLWVDCAEPLNLDRLNRLLRQTPSSNPPSQTPSKSQTPQGNFRNLHAPTLSHLLALLLAPNPTLFPQDLRLLVLSGLDTLLNLDYPRHRTTSTSNSKATSSTETSKWLAGRRYAVLASLSTSLAKVAAVQNAAVLVTMGVTTRSRAEVGAGPVLVPAVGGSEWEQGIWSRVVLFRDFGTRWAGVQKVQGRSLVSRSRSGDGDGNGSGGLGRLVPFRLMEGGGIASISTSSADSVAAAGDLRRDRARGGHSRYASIRVDSAGGNDKGTGTGTEVPPRPADQKPPTTSHLGPHRQSQVHVAPAKRSFAEIADSEGEEDAIAEGGEDVDEYGWMDAYEQALAGEIEGMGGNVETPRDGDNEVVEGEGKRGWEELG